MLQKVVLISLVLCSLTGCGIDEVIYVAPPKLISTPSENDPLLARAVFQTPDGENRLTGTRQFTYTGCDIFYRAYENRQVAQSEQTSINNYIRSNPSNAMNYLKNNMRYVRMASTHDPANNRVLIGSASTDRFVYVRFGFSGSNSAMIALFAQRPEDPPNTAGFSLGSPLRTSDLGVLPFARRPFAVENFQKGDIDFVGSRQDTTASSEIYVNLYVVSYGFDSGYNLIYSEPISLGMIAVH